jgi:tetratricopeptide (TPR) repeat protein/predicted Ser/Thr protein kinase
MSDVDPHDDARARGYPTAPPESASGEPTLAAAGAGSGRAPTSALDHPERVGRYRIDGILGEGGMGVVYRAEQTHPVRRTVALKLIKLGFDTRQVVARFDAERQALAMLDHPNVARVFDAGADDRGRPYFVMEYVDGVPLTQYCDERRLPTAQRLELFVQACTAIQHAHQKGIIHRDLKPGNLLVHAVDGRPAVKVIDFGLAKAMGEPLAARAQTTEHGQLLGTPEYMAPEQASGGGAVDTRADVYALGVILYELLTGALPFDSSSLRAGSQAEIERTIREVDPPRPSARLTRDAGRMTRAAHARSTEPQALVRALRNDLDWVVMRAIAKDPERRYASVSELAGDVRRYLGHEPVLAGPPTAAYRLRKFVRRNRGGVVAASAVALALVVGLAATGWALVGQSRARAEAERRRAEAQAANEGLQEVNQFFTRDVIGAASPAVTLGKELTVREALDNAAAGVEQKFAGRPLVQADIATSIGLAYRALGRPNLGEPHVRAALALRRATLGPEHRMTLASTNDLATILHEQGKFDETESLYRQVLADARRRFGDDDELTLTTVNNLADLLRQRGRLNESEALFREAVERRRRLHDEDHLLLLSSLNNLALVLNEQGKLDEAEPLFRHALARNRVVRGEDHPETLLTMGNLAMLLLDRKQYAEAEALATEKLERSRRVLGVTHFSTLTAANNLAMLLQAQGKWSQAEPLMRDALAKARESPLRDHPSTLALISNFAGVLQKQGKLAEAEPLHREAVERAARLMRPRHPQRLRITLRLAALLDARQKHPEAEVLFKDVYQAATTMPAGELPPAQGGELIAPYGLFLARQGRLAEAEPPLREAQARLVDAPQTDGATIVEVLNALADLCDKTNRRDAAAAFRADAARRAAGTQPAATAPAR